MFVAFCCTQICHFAGHYYYTLGGPETVRQAVKRSHNTQCLHGLTSTGCGYRLDAVAF